MKNTEIIVISYALRHWWCQWCHSGVTVVKRVTIFSHERQGVWLAKFCTKITVLLNSAKLTISVFSIKT